MNFPFIEILISQKFMDVQGLLQDHNIRHSVEEIIQFTHYINSSILIHLIYLLNDQLFVLIFEEIKNQCGTSSDVKMMH